MGCLVLMKKLFRYLHEVCSPSLVHKNIKSANILLDAELNPHLSDSGLSSLVPNTDQVKFEPFKFTNCNIIRCEEFYVPEALDLSKRTKS